MPRALLMMFCICWVYLRFDFQTRQQEKRDSLIKALIRTVMSACSLSQQDLADLTGSSLSRVKAMSSGRVAKLKPEEIKALVQKLNIRAEWLVTGDGPMFRSDGEQELERRLGAVAGATEKAQIDGLSADEQTRVQMLLTGLEIVNADLIRQALNVLSTDEKQLIEDYRQSAPEGKKALRSTARVFAKSGASAHAGERSDTSISVSGFGNRVAGNDYHEK